MKDPEATSKISQSTSIKQDMFTTSTYNEDKSLLLEVVQVPGKSPVSEFHYKVLKAGSRKVVKEDQFKGSAVRWNDKRSLKLIPYVGIEKKPRSENPEELLENNNDQQAIIIPLEENND